MVRSAACPSGLLTGFTAGDNVQTATRQGQVKRRGWSNGRHSIAPFTTAHTGVFERLSEVGASLATCEVKNGSGLLLRPVCWCCNPAGSCNVYGNCLVLLLELWVER